MTILNTELISKILEIVRSSPKRVYSRADLVGLYFQITSEWYLPKKITQKGFVDALIEELFQKIRLTSPYKNPPIRYSLEKFSLYELALSFQKDSYLSHGTAAFLHGLTEQNSSTIYVNKEQSFKSRSNSLTQGALNMAFSRKQRQSKYVIRHGQSRITMLNGKNTGRLGVQKIQGKQQEDLELTGIERTLIDITVRPSYAGGVNHVLQCYVNARNKIEPQKLIRTLQELEYIYPYHQAVGFYMQKAGFDQTLCAKLKLQGLKYDFFLAHGIKKQLYNPDWKIYYPAGFSA